MNTTELGYNPQRVVLTALHLVILGVYGTVVLSILFSFTVTGFGLVPVFGLGVVILVGCVYFAWALAWLEIERAAGLYDLDVAPLRFSTRTKSGFSGWLRMIWSQAKSARMWQALANLFIGTTIGTLFITGIGISFVIAHGLTERLGIPEGIGTATLAFVLGSIFAVLLGWGLGWLFRVITMSIMHVGGREAKLVEQHQGAVRAADVERTRIERDLHDGVQPRLVSVAMTLDLAQQQIEENPQVAKQLIAEAHSSTKSAVTELRQLARGIYASVLDDRGLEAALSALAARSHIPVSLDVELVTRASRQAEAAVYFAIAETLTNATKHSRATQSTVIVRERGGHNGRRLWARIEDNGVGGARVVSGGGLDGIINRIKAAGGTWNLMSPHGGPTTVEVEVPCA